MLLLGLVKIQCVVLMQYIPKKYRDMNPDKFNYDVMTCCHSFEICENTDGDVIITCKSPLQHSKVLIVHRISFTFLKEIEIQTDYDI